MDFSVQLAWLLLTCHAAALVRELECDRDADWRSALTPTPRRGPRTRLYPRGGC